MSEESMDRSCATCADANAPKLEGPPCRPCLLVRPNWRPGPAVLAGIAMRDAARRDGVIPTSVVQASLTSSGNDRQGVQPVRGEDFACRSVSRSGSSSNVVPEPAQAVDPVTRPSHYQGAIECIDAIRAQLPPGAYEGFLRGQVSKYMWRLGRKGPALDDARKALWYLERLKRELEANL